MSSKPSIHQRDIWPKECEKRYEKITNIGKGAFASVCLAKSRDSNTGEPNFVAVKLIDTTNEIKTAYANREIQILNELNHLNIVNLIRVIDQEQNDQDFRCIVLSYEAGPTLEQLLLAGGALGIPLTQLVFKQLISAVAYMHRRAVIHRDIKPDNIIITGSVITDNDVWNDGEEGIESAKKGKWVTKLVDFGFARALGPEQINAENKTCFLKRAVNGDSEVDMIAFEASTPSEIVNSPLEDSIGNQNMGLDRSISTKEVMNLSALGNQNYSAPEIVKGVRAYLPRGISNILSSSVRDIKTSGTRLMNETLGSHVADYGMSSDSFSVGATLRYALTGVPPHLDVNEFMALRGSLVAVSLRALGKAAKILKKNKKKEKKRIKRYRAYDELPKEAVRLVRGLTMWKASERTTARAALFYPWLCENESTDGKPMFPKEIERKRVDFLKCVVGEEEGNVGIQKPVICFEE